MALLLDEDAWQTLILKACKNDPAVVSSIDELWQRRAVMDQADPSGELRYYRVVLDGLELILGPATEDVSTSDGGGQSGQWGQHFEHLIALHKLYEDKYTAVLKAVQANVGVSILPMSVYSLTPVLPGYIDPASPGYAGDVRYHRGRHLNGGW